MMPEKGQHNFKSHTVSSILEYRYVVFSNLPLYLSDAIEKSVKPLPSKNFSYVIIN